MPTSISIAVVEQNGHFLIGQRPSGKPLAGLWEFPGGKVKPDESAENAAVRECLEETGISIRVLAEYPEHVEHYDHDTLHLRFYHCVPSEPQAIALPPFRWVARAELASYEFPSGNRELLELLRR